MLSLLNAIIVGFFGAAIFFCAVFGSSRGHRIRRVNAHVVFFFLCHIVALYALSISVDFTLSAWLRDDGPIDINVGRFLKSFFVIITFALLATYRMKEDALDLGLHAAICITTSAMLYMSVQSFKQNDRTSWLATSIVFFVLFILHILKESMHPEIRNPTLIRVLAFFVVFYIVFYLFATIVSPFHQNLISFEVYEILMALADIITTLFCSIPIVHYSWALTMPLRPYIRPGDITKGGYDNIQLARMFHQFE
ncbi:MAG: hypothetical protein ACOVQN_02520 [Exiguobacterium sp.]|jgi:hypothetical protein